MYQANVFINWHHFRKDKRGGQVATLLTLVIAIIFLFVVVTLNIGRLSQKKTLTSNAADAAALRLASYLASYGNYLSWTFLKGGTKKCGDWDWTPLVSVLGFFASWWYGGWLGYIGMGASGLSAWYSSDVVPDKISEEYEKNFKKLGKDIQFSERAIAYALKMCVDDTEKERDIHDYDKDDDTTDEISRFDGWYMTRLKALAQEAKAKEAGRAIQVECLLDDVERFAGNTDAFRVKQIEDATRATMIEVEGDCPECGDSVQIVAAGPPAGIVGEIIVLFNELLAEGIELKPDFFWKPGADIVEDTEENKANFDELDELTARLDNFYLFSLGEKNGLITQSKADFDAFAGNYDIWMALLYSEAEEEAVEAWYDVWQEEISRIDSWRPDLYGVISQLDEDITEAKDDAERQEKLLALQERVGGAIQELDKLQDTLSDFNETILVSYLQNQEESYAQKRQATYSWQDAIEGWHHVRVETSAFNIPKIKPNKDKDDLGLRSRQCLKLKNYAGSVNVSVIRYDQGVDTTFARKKPLWKFRYVKDAQAEGGKFSPKDPEAALDYGVKSEATVSYTYNKLPRLEDVK